MQFSIVGSNSFLATIGLIFSILFVVGCSEYEKGTAQFDVTPYRYPIDTFDCATANKLPFVLSFFESDKMYLNLVTEGLIEKQGQEILRSVDEFRNAIELNSSICLKEVSHIETLMFNPGQGFNDFRFHIVTGRDCSPVNALSQYILLSSGHIVSAVPSDLETLASKCLRRGDIRPVVEN